MRSPDRPSTEAERGVIFWVGFLASVGMGVVMLVLGVTAGEDKAEEGRQAMGWAWKCFVAAGAIYVLRIILGKIFD